MLAEQVDAIGFEALERRFGDHADALGTTVERPLRVAVLEAEFGGDHDLVAKRRHRFADQFLVDERAVALGGVEESDALLEGGLNQFDARGLLGGLAVAEAQTHAAESDRGHFQPAVTQFALLHVVAPWRIPRAPALPSAGRTRRARFRDTSLGRGVRDNNTDGMAWGYERDSSMPVPVPVRGRGPEPAGLGQTARTAPPGTAAGSRWFPHRSSSRRSAGPLPGPA
ncbi:hypothetical protein LMG28614_00643 [Paraburkholderia ultramafica]|uniref:Uncharacterized protein n=1 Tax=Paraburkholderia ultramafica TaxID=1544867 RepID=A0A6S7AUI9_9BURK|nr:hypothetical protein LMG28614_00643 [Paraburkholderia ultramafica]